MSYLNIQTVENEGILMSFTNYNFFGSLKNKNITYKNKDYTILNFHGIYEKEENDNFEYKHILIKFQTYINLKNIISKLIEDKGYEVHVIYGLKFINGPTLHMNSVLLIDSFYANIKDFRFLTKEFENIEVKYLNSELKCVDEKYLIENEEEKIDMKTLLFINQIKGLKDEINIFKAENEKYKNEIKGLKEENEKYKIDKKKIKDYEELKFKLEETDKLLLKLKNKYIEEKYKRAYDEDCIEDIELDE